MSRTNPVWARKRARILACRYLELLVDDTLPIRDFFDRLIEHGNADINAALVKAYPELLTTDMGAELPRARISRTGSRALFVPELDSYLSFEWQEGCVMRADLS